MHLRQFLVLSSILLLSWLALAFQHHPASPAMRSAQKPAPVLPLADEGSEGSAGLAVSVSP